MVDKQAPKLLVKELPGVLGPRTLAVVNNRIAGGKCQGGHKLPKGWFVKSWYKCGSMIEMDYCFPCSKKLGWIE